jgi:hypothetical protein
MSALPATLTLPATVVRDHLFELLQLLSSKRVQRIVAIDTSKKKQPRPPIQITYEESVSGPIELSPRLRHVLMKHRQIQP